MSPGEKQAAGAGALALFAYGTLSLPQVMEALTGRVHVAVPARLPGYARFRLRNAVFPGIVPHASSHVDGVLYEALDAATLVLIDRFEDALYERCEVTVLAADRERRAFAYVVASPFRDRLTSRPWGRQEFERRHLQRYVAMCRRLRAAARKR